MTVALQDSRLMKAVRREPTDTTPVWIMRQAGRYLPEYMEVRSKVSSVLELCRRPDLAAEVTISAREVLGVDAAILFAESAAAAHPDGIRSHLRTRPHDSQSPQNWPRPRSRSGDERCR